MQDVDKCTNKKRMHVRDQYNVLFPSAMSKHMQLAVTKVGLDRSVVNTRSYIGVRARLHCCRYEALLWSIYDHEA